MSAETRAQKSVLRSMCQLVLLVTFPTHHPTPTILHQPPTHKHTPPTNTHHTQLLRRLKREPVLPSLDLAGVADLIKSGKARRIIVMTGAGVSVSAGIPDFRTPGTGLYSQLER